MEKACKKCGLIKPIDQFPKSKQWITGTCKTCKNARAAERYAADPQGFRDRQKRNRMANLERYRAKDLERKRAADPEVLARRDRKHHLMTTYGLSIADYDRMHEAQNGLCAICHLPHIGPGKWLHVDHDEETGIVRGLLCGPCNTALGQMKHNPLRLIFAAEYLKRNGFFLLTEADLQQTA